MRGEAEGRAGEEQRSRRVCWDDTQAFVRSQRELIISVAQCWEQNNDSDRLLWAAGLLAGGDILLQDLHHCVSGFHVPICHLKLVWLIIAKAPHVFGRRENRGNKSMALQRYQVYDSFDYKMNWQVWDAGFLIENND